jgi:hypothetical protein
MDETAQKNPGKRPGGLFLGYVIGRKGNDFSGMRIVLASQAVDKFPCHGFAALAAFSISENENPLTCVELVWIGVDGLIHDRSF